MQIKKFKDSLTYNIKKYFCLFRDLLIYSYSSSLLANKKQQLRNYILTSLSPIFLL